MQHIDNTGDRRRSKYELGIPPTQRRVSRDKLLTPEQITAAAKQVLQDGIIPTAKAYNIGRCTLMKYLKEAGYHERKNLGNPALAADYYVAWQAGYSCREIGEVYHLDSTTIQSRLSRYEYKTPFRSSVVRAELKSKSNYQFPTFD